MMFAFRAPKERWQMGKHVMPVSAETHSETSTVFVVRSGATALATSLLLFATGPAVAATYTTFDVNGSSATYAIGINIGGSVTGYYTDLSGNYHGFVRAAGGTYPARKGLNPKASTATT